jgi:hypothetical protein
MEIIQSDVFYKVKLEYNHGHARVVRSIVVS